MKPSVGIVVCGFTDNRQFVTNPYIQAIRYSGGLPVILPLVRSDALLDQYVDLCAGFLFCGGGDITPLLFGQEPQNGNGETSITLDLFQIRLMKKILSSGKPLLAICRGMQVLNTACGGTIWQDLSLVPGKTLNHMQQSRSRSDVSHRIRTEKDSIVRRCLGPVPLVNSFHHQAVQTPGNGLTVTARAGDGTIEAVEADGNSFVVGVQWHPECMYRSSPETRVLFQEFIAETRLT